MSAWSIRLEPILTSKRWWWLLLVFLLITSGLLSAKILRFEQIQALAREKYGEDGIRAVRRWESLLAAGQTVDDLEKMRRVNDFFNHRIDFMSDIDAWGKKEYWASPLETLATNRGDCEDFAIAKYATLLLLNIPEQQLRLTYVKARIGGPNSRLSQAHMVLDYYPDVEGEPLILDNMIGEIRPAARRPDLDPIFSFNSEGLWFDGDSESSGDATVHLSRWRDVLARMRAEGF